MHTPWCSIFVNPIFQILSGVARGMPAMFSPPCAPKSDMHRRSGASALHVEEPPSARAARAPLQVRVNGIDILHDGATSNRA